MKRKGPELYDERPHPPPHTQLTSGIRRRLTELGEPGQLPVEQAIKELTLDIVGTEPESWGPIFEMIEAITIEQPHKLPLVSLLVEQINKDRSVIAEATVDLARDKIALAVEKHDAARLKSFLRLACCLTVVDIDSVVSFLEELTRSLSEEVFEALVIATTYVKQFHPQADTAKLEEKLQKYVDEYEERTPYGPFEGPESPYKAQYAISYLIEATKDALVNGWNVDFMPKLEFSPQEEVTPKHRLKGIQLPEELKFGNKDLVRVKLYLPQGEIESVPDPNSMFGYVIRDIAADIIGNMDFNRKEVTRQLITLDLFFNTEKFTSPALPFDALKEMQAQGAPTIKVEDVAMEAIIEQMLQLPSPEFPPLYYASIMIEACIMAPQGIAPVLGRAWRFLFAHLECLNVDLFWRLVSWFAHHMSNFSFTWKWHEWKEFLELPQNHPKYVFMKQLIVKQVQLSYTERVSDALPEEFLSLVPKTPERPAFEFKEDARALDLIDACERSSRSIADVIGDISSHTQNKYMGDDAFKYDNEFGRIIATVICEMGGRSLSYTKELIGRMLPHIKEIIKPEVVVDAVLEYWTQSPWTGLAVVEAFIADGLVPPILLVERVLKQEHLLLSAAGYDVLTAHPEETKASLDLIPTGEKWADWWKYGLQKVFEH